MSLSMYNIELSSLTVKSVPTICYLVTSPKHRAGQADVTDSCRMSESFHAKSLLKEQLQTQIAPSDMPDRIVHKSKRVHGHKIVAFEES